MRTTRPSITTERSDNVIDTHGNIRGGRPRRGKEQLEYQRVKRSIVELLDLEVPDREIAARIGLSPNGFYSLKKRIFAEIVTQDIKVNVAARQYMRIERQMMQLIQYMDTMWAAGTPPDATYITAFTNLNRRLADLVGANAAMEFNVNTDPEEKSETRDHEYRMAQQLNRFYELQDRLSGGDRGIGSGMTKEERDRELANLKMTVGELGIGVEGLSPEQEIEMDEGDGDDDSDNIEDAIEVIDDPGFNEHDWDVGDEVVEVASLTNVEKRIAIRECASGSGDQETPGRWVKGKFVSWWHDMGDETVEAAWDIDQAPPADDAMFLE